MTTPILDNVRQRGQRTTRRAVHTGSWLWYRANRRCARLPAYLGKAIIRFGTDDQYTAIVFSYWGLLSLFPLVLLLIAVDSTFHSLWFARQEIFATLDNFIPAVAGQFIHDSIVNVWHRQDLFGVVSIDCPTTAGTAAPHCPLSPRAAVLHCRSSAYPAACPSPPDSTPPASDFAISPTPDSF